MAAEPDTVRRARTGDAEAYASLVREHQVGRPSFGRSGRLLGPVLVAVPATEVVGTKHRQRGLQRRAARWPPLPTRPWP